jgi:hypothetical protein
MEFTLVSGSFRDPMGFVFQQRGKYYRQINQAYKSHYQQLMSSGLYESLTATGLMLTHESIEKKRFHTSEDAYEIIEPKQLDLVTYPYEWSFSQLKDAALATISIQKIALKHNMILKDASCFNIQYFKGRPLLIDTLSFENYEVGKPWIAYRQFCQHFLAPLALMSYVDIRLNQLCANFIDGIPLDLTVKLLPFKARLNLSLFLHLFLHAKAQSKHQNNHSAHNKKATLSKIALLGLIDSLESSIKKLTWRPANTTWFDYYENNNNYGETGLFEKEEIIENFAKLLQPSTVWDLGANTGRFSRIFSKHNASVVSWDIDPACVELNYLKTKQDNETKILPLFLDLTNPTSSRGWACNERSSFMERGPVDLILALGLVHHLAIGNNVPLSKIFSFFAAISSTIIIEFVPKEDSNAQKLLANRTDIFDLYHQEGFESAAQEEFDIIERIFVPGTQRIIYLLKKRS